MRWGSLLLQFSAQENSLREVKLPKGKFETHLLNYLHNLPSQSDILLEDQRVTLNLLCQ